MSEACSDGRIVLEFIYIDTPWTNANRIVLSQRQNARIRMGCKATAALTLRWRLTDKGIKLPVRKLALIIIL